MYILSGRRVLLMFIVRYVTLTVIHSTLRYVDSDPVPTSGGAEKDVDRTQATQERSRRPTLHVRVLRHYTTTTLLLLLLLLLHYYIVVIYVVRVSLKAFYTQRQGQLLTTAAAAADDDDDDDDDDAVCRSLSLAIAR